MRLGRTFDLTGVAAADAPRFAAQLAYSAEQGYDFVLVEAHTVGQDDWRTLPDLNGRSTTAMPADCNQGFLLGLHPHLLRYIVPSTGGNDPCDPVAPGIWHMFTGESGGWRQVAFDLSAYAGTQVEIVVSYVADPAFGGNGAILDDTRLETNAGVSEAEGFEAGLGAWSVLGAPEGSLNFIDWEVADRLGRITAGVVTADTVLLGFGLEQLESPEARAEVIADSLALIT
jgi:hypothetical protein